MVKARLWRRLRGFDAIIGAVACLCVLQGLVLAASPETRFERLYADSSVIVSAEGQLCGGDGGEAPAHARHSHCCILCTSCADGGLLRFVAALFDIALSSAPAPGVAIARRYEDDPITPPTGWASSWSSRAPPFFS